MNTPVLRPATGPVANGGDLAPDLVHDTVVRTPGGVFAGGWVDDIPDLGAEPRQKEES